MTSRFTETEQSVNPDDFTKEELVAMLTESRAQADGLRSMLQDRFRYITFLENGLIKWKYIAGFLGCIVAAVLLAVVLEALCG